MLWKNVLYAGKDSQVNVLLAPIKLHQSIFALTARWYDTDDCSNREDAIGVYSFLREHMASKAHLINVRLEITY